MQTHQGLLGVGNMNCRHHVEAPFAVLVLLLWIPIGLVVQQSYGGWTISCLENRKFSGEWARNFEGLSRSSEDNVCVLFALVCTREIMLLT